MNKKNCIAWLFNELPALVNAGILDDGTASRLREHYGPMEAKDRRSLAMIVFAILGFFLVGLGIILVFAHNWENLSKPVRAGLSFAPLVLGWALAGWTIVRREQFIREGAAVFLMAAVGSSISLVAQTYHISGDFPGFMLTWMLLSVPLVYLMNVSVPAALYWIGVAVWACAANGEHRETFLYWPLAAIPLGHLWMAARDNRHGVRSVSLSWALCLTLCVALPFALEVAISGLWKVAYAGLFGVLYLVGDVWFRAGASFWRRPFQTVAALGTISLSLVLTYEDVWRKESWRYADQWLNETQWQNAGNYAASFGLLAASCCWLGVLVKRKQTDKILYGIFPLLVGAAYFGISGKVIPAGVAMAVFNVYLFALGMVAIVLGLRRSGLAQLNGGLAILSALIVARFFDTDLSFALRGVVFIALGAAFLVANVVMRRKKARI